MNSFYARQSGCPVPSRPRTVPQFPPRVSARDKQDGLVRSSPPVKNQGTVGFQEAGEVEEILRNTRQTAVEQTGLTGTMLSSKAEGMTNLVLVEGVRDVVGHVAYRMG